VYFDFPALGHRQVFASYDGGDSPSDGPNPTDGKAAAPTVSLRERFDRGISRLVRDRP
jgi:hypothetical protein